MPSFAIDGKKQAPGNLLTIELSGDFARESGNIEEAFEAYRQIADPHNPLSRRAVGYMNLASLHEEQRDVEQALECRFDSVDGLVDDRVVTNVDAFTIGQFARLAFWSHVESDDDGI